MKSSFPWSYRLSAVLLVVLLCGAPELLAQAAQQPQAPAQDQQQNSQQLPQSAEPAADQQAPARQNQSLDVDPSKGPLQPVPNATDDQLPNAPSAAQPAQPAPSTSTQPTAQQQKPAPPEPQGVAVAGEAKTAGGPASKPAGTAIAPAKQRQVRSLLIKIGAIAAGGAALGAIYGLTRGTPSNPPHSTAPDAIQVH